MQRQVLVYLLSSCLAVLACCTYLAGFSLCLWPESENHLTAVRCCMHSASTSIHHHSHTPSLFPVLLPLPTSPLSALPLPQSRALVCPVKSWPVVFCPAATYLHLPYLTLPYLATLLIPFPPVLSPLLLTCHHSSCIVAIIHIPLPCHFLSSPCQNTSRPAPLVCHPRSSLLVPRHAHTLPIPALSTTNDLLSVPTASLFLFHLLMTAISFRKVAPQSRNYL